MSIRKGQIISNTKAKSANADHLLLLSLLMVLVKKHLDLLCGGQLYRTLRKLFPHILLPEFQLTGENTNESFSHLWHTK